MRISALLLFCLFSNVFASDLLDTISQLELNKRDLSILQSEITSNLEFALDFEQDQTSQNLKTDVGEMVHKQEAILSSFIVFEKKLDFIELKAKYLEMRDLNAEIEDYKSRRVKVQRILDRASGSANLKKYFDFYLGKKFDQAAIAEQGLNFQELSIVKLYKTESELLQRDQLLQDQRLHSLEKTEAEVQKEIAGFQSIFKSLSDLHQLSQKLRQNFKLINL